MSKFNVFAGVAVATLATISLTSPAFAWHPKGEINKYVQNVTSSSGIFDADTAASAVSAKPGDVLKYTIEVKNTAQAAEKQYNDLSFVKITDQLPAGVELTTGSGRVFTKDFGGQVVKPGSKVSVDFTVKVIATASNGQLITNKACFEGDSVVKDNKQQGCDVATTKVNVPVIVTPEVPVVVAVPESAEATAELPAELPRTGVGSVIGLGFGLSVLTYAVAAIVQRRSV